MVQGRHETFQAELAQCDQEVELDVSGAPAEIRHRQVAFTFGFEMGLAFDRSWLVGCGDGSVCKLLAV